MVNWKGKYIPTKGSNIQEVFAGASFYFANWMNALKACPQAEGSFSVFLNASKWVALLNTEPKHLGLKFDFNILKNKVVP